MTYECELIEQTERPTLAVRRRSPVERLPQVLGQGSGEVMAVAAPAGAAPVGAPFAAYEAMWAWLSERDLEHVGPVYEHDLDDPADTPIEQVRTLIVIPVR